MSTIDNNNILTVRLVSSDPLIKTKPYIKEVIRFLKSKGIKNIIEDSESGSLLILQIGSDMARELEREFIPFRNKNKLPYYLTIKITVN